MRKKRKKKKSGFSVYVRGEGIIIGVRVRLCSVLYSLKHKNCAKKEPSIRKIKILGVKIKLVTS
jgi:hypothetical protein